MDRKEIAKRLNYYELWNLTSCIETAIYMTRGGTLISGGFYYDDRSIDHTQVPEGVFKTLDRYKGEIMWSAFHDATDMVRLVPETKEALLMRGQSLTKAQKDVLKDSGYKVDYYCEPLHRLLDKDWYWRKDANEPETWKKAIHEFGDDKDYIQVSRKTVSYLKNGVKHELVECETLGEALDVAEGYANKFKEMNVEEIKTFIKEKN